MGTTDEIIYLKNWAAENDCTLRLDGTIGFDRECVGIIHEGDGHPAHYPEYERRSPASPPPEVKDAYHKNDNLAVLVHDDRDKAVRQLYIWVRRLEENGVTVTVRERKRGAHEGGWGDLLHGTTEPVLVSGKDR